MSDVMSIANSFGFPIAFLVVICVFIWRVLVWLRPWAERILSGHIALVATLAECQRRQETSLEKMSDILAAIQQEKK